MPAENEMALLAAEAPWPISSPAPAWFAALVAVGLYIVVRSAATFLLWLHRAFLRPGRDLAGRYGTWAVVTGATDGIGRAVALELARAGLHLVLVGRSPDKLARVAKEVLAAASPSSCKVRTVAFDLAVTGDDARRGVARVAAAVEGRDVGVLVNNAGATYPCAAYFHEVERPVWEAVVRVNVEAATRITRALLPMMAARGRGAVVNVGSGSSVVVPAFPLYAVYAASKA
jgi:17beta-estradiol 17-dehydrogenase / very-long-chain 3-oxoacyl-CoA reductase